MPEPSLNVSYLKEIQAYWSIQYRQKAGRVLERWLDDGASAPLPEVHTKLSMASVGVSYVYQLSGHFLPTIISPMQSIQQSNYLR